MEVLKERVEEEEEAEREDEAERERAAEQVERSEQLMVRPVEPQCKETIITQEIVQDPEKEDIEVPIPDK